MQFEFKQMEKKYGQKTVKQCVKLVKTLNEEMISRGEELVGLLFYLEKSKRYQEYEGYKKLSFKTFVWEISRDSFSSFRKREIVSGSWATS